MAHKCGLPYTIPRSHTIHAPSEVTRRSVDHSPLAQSAAAGENLPFHLPEQPPQQQPSQSILGPHRRAKSEHGSPESAPVAATEDPTSNPPLDITFFPPPAPASQQSLEPSNETSPEQPASIQSSSNFGKTPLDQIVTSMPSVDMFSSFSTASTTSPVNNMALQDPYQEPLFTSPDCEVPFGTAGFNAPPVDWSSFPIYSSDAPAPTSTQTPSYASFDYNSMGPGLPAPSSSGDISEADEFGALPSLGHSGSDLHDLHSVSEASDMDHVRLSSASSFVGLPQAQLLALNDLESVSIDEFLKTANEETAALEHQLQANIGVGPKPFPDSLAPSEAQTYNESSDDTVPGSTANTAMRTSPTDPTWSATVYDSGSTVDDTYYPPSWTQ